MESKALTQIKVDSRRRGDIFQRPLNLRSILRSQTMKAVSIEEAVAMIPNGASIMVGGFMGVGTPDRLLDELVRQKKSGLTLICNDAAMPGKGVGKLFDARAGVDA